MTVRQEEIDHLLGDDGCLIGVGGWTTSKNTGSENIRGPGTVQATNEGVTVGAKFFPLVDLRSFIAELTRRFAATEEASPVDVRLARLLVPDRLTPTLNAARVPEQDALAPTTVTYDAFFAELSAWITEQDILVADAGFPLIGAQTVPIAARNGFVAQAAWLAIGYSVAAATGVKFANPDRRAVVVVGDGAFHETCQAVSDQPTDYRDDPLQDAPYPYNRLPSWNFVALADAFGGVGRRAATLPELADVLSEIRSEDGAGKNFVVEVVVPQVNIPSALDASAVGEDETANPDWPPAGKF